MNNETDTTTNEAIGNMVQNPYQPPISASGAAGAASAIAPLGSRIGAGVIDSLVPIAIYIPAVIIMIILASIKLGALSSIVMLAAVVLVMGYVFLKDCLPFLGGQSIGKKLMKLRVVTEDGKPITGNWQAGFMRNILMLVWPVELIMLIVREGKPEAGRRIGDDMAKTKVILAPKG
jgi:uncharacterized RDD family membrane protein YckC